ncbi:hypothetical protein FRB95_007174 [Tulasnella sp. JGI-2019a]|nr:hypothetical protein FRB95_007174 [Tulasnella sp. JGI-2019a]
MRDREPASTDHRRLGSEPPSPELGLQLETEADLAEPEQYEAPNNKTKADKRRSKGKEVDPSERGMQSPFEDQPELVGHEQEGGVLEGGQGVGEYPPTNEEEQETKRIEENLKRWELMEKQRRKAARDSRTFRQPTTLIGDVAGYVTGTPSANGYNATSRQSGGTDSGRRISMGGWTQAKTRNSQDEVELTSKRVVTASPPPIEEERSRESLSERVERPRFASPVGSEDSFETAQSHSTSRTDPRNPFSPDPAAEPEADLRSLDSAATERPEQPPREPVSLNDTDDPFKNPSVVAVTPSSPKLDFEAPLLPSPSALSPINSPKPSTSSTLQVPKAKSSKSKSPKIPKTSEPQMVPPPLVRPLDLPEERMPRMEPDPASGHFRRAQHDPQLQQEIEEEMEADKEHGRWWTDWICGCREARRREEQDGRTNPFE